MSENSKDTFFGPEMGKEFNALDWQQRAEAAEAKLARTEELHDTAKARIAAYQGQVSELQARVAEVERPFRNVDDRDWDDLFGRVLPVATPFKFWRAVLIEARQALSGQPSQVAEAERAVVEAQPCQHSWRPFELFPGMWEVCDKCKMGRLYGDDLRKEGGDGP